MNRDDQCSVHRAANLIGRRWTLLILLALYKGPNVKRYNDIKRALPGITPKVLSLRLKELEKEGIITKTVDSHAAPIRCEYSFTKSGESLIFAITGLKHWAMTWKTDRKVCGGLRCGDCPF